MKKTIPALPVQDIKQSMEFYINKLGFKVCHHDEGFCIVVRDEVEIHLWKSGDETWKNKGASLAANPTCSGAEAFLAGAASCRIEVKRIDDCLKENQSVTYNPDTLLKLNPGEQRNSSIRPSSNLLTFYEHTL